ncbi:MAG TPA: aminodeoxychorismate lyase [Gammaproteobacteria bacterium]|nr:aminodeoxychorismate lyase [Gammaproteobacteria bacterium]
MIATCWVNGIAGTQLSVADRGLQYGDGLFETLPVRNGRVPLLEAHLQRLNAGSRRLGFPALPLTELRTEIAAAARDQESAILKLVVTRGESARGYRAPADPQLTRILSRHAYPAYPDAWREQGICVRVCRTVLGINTQLAGLKHLNRLEQVLARAEWDEPDRVQEGLMRDADGAVIEGTMTNVFVRLADGRIMTPDLQHCGVAGVMRGYLLERLREAGLAPRIGTLRVADLDSAREVFVCNSVIGVWPVRELDGRHYAVGELTRMARQWADQA